MDVRFDLETTGCSPSPFTSDDQVSSDRSVQRRRNGHAHTKAFPVHQAQAQHEQTHELYKDAFLSIIVVALFTIAHSLDIIGGIYN